MTSHSDIISLWPSYSSLAEDLGVKAHAVQKWKMRDSIPGEYWTRIAEDAQRRGLAGVTLETLADYAASKAAPSSEKAA